MLEAHAARTMDGKENQRIHHRASRSSDILDGPGKEEKADILRARHAERGSGEGHHVGHGGRKKRQGSPRMRWIDEIRELTDMSLYELNRAVVDRDEWRKRVMNVTRSRPRLDGTR